MPLTHIAVVLDRSGSMDEIKDEVVDGFNEQVKRIKKDFGKKARVSLYSFASTIRKHFVNKTSKKLKKLSKSDYTPSGWTSLNDAVAMSIDEIASHSESKKDRFLVIIISDGKENHSTEYKGPAGSRALAKKIKEKTKTGMWTFAYLGSSDLDLEKIRRTYAIPAGNMAAFLKTKAGFKRASSVLGSSVTSYSNSGKTSTDSFFKEKSKKA